MSELPLFPLKTVLLPGNKLSLKIFEPRYVDMVARCMREQSCFGVVLIQEGEETTSDSKIVSIGTTASICDWQNRADGLLGITALGEQRFQINSTRKQSDGLTIADVELLSETEYPKVPEQYFYLQELLEHISAQEGKTQIDLSHFSAILFQLIFLLPLDSKLKQRLLEVPDCQDRAVILHAELIRLGVIQYIKPEQKESLK